MSTNTSQDLIVEVSDRVATITLNRPKKLNALTMPMIENGIARLMEFANDPDIGAIVLTGEGRGFCAGGDVSTMGAGITGTQTLESGTDGLRRAQEFAWLLFTIPKVTIAAVNGYAVGGGLGIALSCDLRIASDKAKFGTAYAKVGLGGDFGITWQLTRLAGIAKAKELFFLADIISAEEAHRVGLVNRVVPHDELHDEVGELAHRIAHGALVSYRYMKENVNLAIDSDFRTILDREAFTQTRCYWTEDHLEGAKAFMEKREPRFKGK